MKSWFGGAVTALMQGLSRQKKARGSSPEPTTVVSLQWIVELTLWRRAFSIRRVEFGQAGFGGIGVAVEDVVRVLQGGVFDEVKFAQDRDMLHRHQGNPLGKSLKA